MIHINPNVEKGRWLPLTKKWITKISFWVIIGARPEIRTWNEPVPNYTSFGGRGIEVFV